MSARDQQPAVYHDRPLSCAGIVLPIPDGTGALRYSVASPWVVSSGGSEIYPDGSIVLGTGAPEVIVSATRRAVLHAGSIGSSVQAYDAGLTSLVAADGAAGLPYVSAANTWTTLTLAADKGIYATSSSALSTFDLTAAGRALVDDASAAAQLVTLGIADYLVRATVTAADATGGSTDSAITVQVYRLDGTTPIARAVQLLIAGSATQYSHYSALSGTLQFTTGATGSVIDSGAGWALIETSATGAWAGTGTNSADEVLYISVTNPASGQSDASKGVAVVASNADQVEWSA